METKLLDLNAYGVSEMSGAEMRETDGGGLITGIVIGLVLGVVASELLDRNCSIQNFRDGFESVRNN